MLDSILKAPQEIRRDIAARAQARRLALNMSQKELAARSGVSLGSVKRFETTGEALAFPYARPASQPP